MFVLGSDLAMASVSLCQISKNLCFTMVFCFCVFVLPGWNMHISPVNTLDIEYILALKLALGPEQAMTHFQN